ncbi:hypothetical protein GCM10010275_72530 [Streptomyces litmocidini]|nr:hypothetical protein GCM10010233_65500 [Streptomyces gancidicus]GGV20741.1 hypothetical protein GCM10010275_72530 [Streptomyces litmocidini]
MYNLLINEIRNPTGLNLKFNDKSGIQAYSNHPNDLYDFTLPNKLLPMEPSIPRIPKTILLEF